MTSKLKSFNRLASSLAILAILGLSLSLLIYVGYGEARRTYPRFEIDKLAAQGDLVKTSVQTFLLADLPIEQFPGFATLADPILNSDPSITAIYVSNAKGQVIFINAQDNASATLAEMSSGFASSNLQDREDPYSISENAQFYQVSLELRSRFEAAGYINVILPRSLITDRLNSSFLYVGIIGFGLLVIYALYVFIKISRWGGRGEGTRWLPVSYGVAFLVMAIVVVATLISIYTSGIQAKTQALTNSLVQRLNVPISLGLDINSFEGLDRTFKNYQKLNPDLSVVALTVDNKVAIHTDANLVNTQWQPNSGNFEYEIALNQTGVTGSTVVHLGIPQSVVYGKLWRGVKNFVALFIASMLLSLVLFNLIRAYSRYKASGTSLVARRLFQLGLMAPLYFVSIFADALTKSFLPQYFEKLAVEAGVDKSLTAVLFTTYFICYALALVPTGRFADKYGLKPLFLVGSILNFGQLLMLAFVPNFFAMFGVEVLAGFGQGIFFIAVQSFLLKVAASSERTRAASTIVFGYNGGMISGLAIGALFVADPALGQRGVFIIGAVISLVVLIVSIVLLPRQPELPPEEVTASSRMRIANTSNAIKPSFFGGLARVFTDFRFFKAVLLVAIPTKIIMVGLIVSNLPLILSKQNYLAEDIGQIMMFYSGGVLISSAFVSRLVDRTGKLNRVLLIGLVGSGVGVALVGLLGWDWGNLSFLGVTVLLVGLALLGLSHGCIQAPVITYVADTKTADSLGRVSATSIYRLYERLGNITGPILISQLLIWGNQSTLVITWMGVGITVMGLLFAIGLPRRTKNSTQPPAQLDAIEVSVT